MKGKLLKAIVAICISAALISGVVMAAVEYANGSAFHLFNFNREMQNNQLLFDDDKAAAGDKTGGDSDKSFLQNDDNSSNEINGDDSGYLFKQNTQTDVGKNAGIAVKDTSIRPGAATPDSVFDITDAKGDIDLVLPGKGGSTTIIVPGGNSNSDDNNSGGDDNQPDKPSNDDNNSSNGPKPAPGYGSNANDPQNEKNNPTSGFFTSDVYNEDVVPSKPNNDDGTNDSVVIAKPSFEVKNWLYLGQTVNKLTIYNALDTYVTGADGKLYLWGENDFNKYVKINGVSFDGGKTWTNSFPLEIPMNVPDNTMLISTSYRFSTNGKWVDIEVSYLLEESRVLILNSQIKKDESVIKSEYIINIDAYGQYYSPNQKVNLMRYQWDYLGKENLTSLFPGWTENGKFVSWFYNVSSGRHVLEPAENVPLDKSYTVALKYYWMNEDYEVSPDYSNLSYLQTLVNYSKTRTGTLNVPKYIQSIDIDSENSVTVDYLNVPSTVLYINGTNSGLVVNEGYSVDANNPIFRSANGVLMNKAGTVISGIPMKMSELTIPGTIKSVSLLKGNKLSKITLKASSLDKLPVMNYENISSNCTIVVNDSIWEQFLFNNRQTFSKNNIYVAPASSPDTAYTIKNDMIVSRDGSIKKVLESSDTSLYIPIGATNVQKGAFDSVKNVTAIILPQNGKKVTFDNGCFDNTNIKMIICYSKAQFKESTAAAGDDIRVTMISTSKEGYTYYTVYEDGVSECVLTSAPNVTEFNGIVTSEDGEKVTITAIGSKAFADNAELRWVILPESVYQIGKSAFENCTSLEGVLINATDTIIIGYGSFDGCDSLRFVASNAHNGILSDGYDFAITDSHLGYAQMLYAPTDCVGYSTNWTSFTIESNVAKYDIISISEQGRALFGVSDYGDPWLLLRAGSMLDSSVILPKTAIEIWDFSFSDTDSPTGYYTVNFEDIEYIYLHDYAFINSEIGYEVYLPSVYYLGINVFADCLKLEKATFDHIDQSFGISSGLFTGSDNLTTIIMNDYTPPMGVLTAFVGFQFNYNWTAQEESEKLHLIVPDFSEVSYIKQWRYPLAGYTGTGYQTPYEQMWDDIKMELTDWDTWEAPSDEEVEAVMTERLLDAENRLRKMMGLEPATEPTELYHFTVSADGYITLTKTSSNLETAILEGTEVGLLDGWSLDFIATGAFSQSKNLNYVFLPMNLLGLSNNAFKGVESPEITFIAAGIEPPELMDFEVGTPFSFGVDDSVMHIYTFGDNEEYIKAWIFPMAGYNNLAEMRRLIATELMEKLGQEPTPDQVDEEITDRLLVAENRLRSMIEGMETITDKNDMVGVDIDEILGKSSMLRQILYINNQDMALNILRRKEEQ